jgi:hypothetical protein
MKHMKKRGVVLDPSNLQLSPYSLLIITIKSLHFLKFKHKLIFKTFFFLIPSLRKEREIHWFLMIERKMS